MSLVAFNEKVGMPAVNINFILPELISIVKAGRTPCLWGEAGIGKTASVYQLGEILGKPVFTFICSHMSESDMGLPFRSESEPNWFKMLPPKQVYDALKATNGAVLFFDEITRADRATLNAIFSVVSERRIGDISLGSNIDIVAACNPDDGEYSVSDILSDPAWRRRLVHMWVETDSASWLRYAKQKGLNNNVIEYISAKPQQLIGVEARAAGKIYPNPAAWESVSKYLNVNDQISTIAISGIVGYDTARDLFQFITNIDYKITPSQICESLASDKDLQTVLSKIKKDGRGDILTELVRGVAIFLNEKPTVAVTAPNLFYFWYNIPEENQVLLTGEIERYNVGDKQNYFSSLYSELKKEKDWGKLLSKLKGITRLK
jgi:hypothetical protein